MQCSILQNTPPMFQCCVSLRTPQLPINAVIIPSGVPGAPTLPLGGFGGLKPPLTVVKKAAYLGFFGQRIARIIS